MEDERIAMPSRANQRFGPGSGYDLHACFESERSDRAVIKNANSSSMFPVPLR